MTVKVKFHYEIYQHLTTRYFSLINYGIAGWLVAKFFVPHMNELLMLNLTQNFDTKFHG